MKKLCCILVVFISHSSSAQDMEDEARFCDTEMDYCMYIPKGQMNHQYSVMNGYTFHFLFKLKKLPVSLGYFVSLNLDFQDFSGHPYQPCKKCQNTTAGLVNSYDLMGLDTKLYLWHHNKSRIRPFIELMAFTSVSDNDLFLYTPQEIENDLFSRSFGLLICNGASVRIRRQQKNSSIKANAAIGYLFGSNCKYYDIHTTEYHESKLSMIQLKIGFTGYF